MYKRLATAKKDAYSSFVIDSRFMIGMPGDGMLTAPDILYKQMRFVKSFT